jgi:hypothetical protein
MVTTPVTLGVVYEVDACPFAAVTGFGLENEPPAPLSVKFTVRPGRPFPY